MPTGASLRPAPTIFIQTNGVHTGIVMPVVAEGIDWRDRLRASDLPDPRGAGQWLAFGWGDRGFYVDTPTWRQARLSTIVTALTGSGATVMHVDHLDPFMPDETGVRCGCARPNTGALRPSSGQALPTGVM